MRRLAPVMLAFTALQLLLLPSPAHAPGPGPAPAYAAPAMASAFDQAIERGVLGVTNEVWQHTSYMVTAEGDAWYGASMDVKTSGLWLDGFDDQHEISLTIYSDRRYGETGAGYNQYPTYALAIMRSDRERLSFNLRPEPGSIDVITLSTCAPADDQNTVYTYAKDSDGDTLTVAPNSQHNLSVRSTGVKAYVYNRDTLPYGFPSYNDGVPVYAQWPDLSDADGPTKGHWAYKWEAFLDGKLIDSAWLDSPTGRVKLESNKRHAALASAGSTTYVTNARLGTGVAPFTTGAWVGTVPTTSRVTRGLYRWNATTPYTTMRADLPPAPPTASFVKYSNPVAYDLKSLTSTRFYTSVSRPNTWAELSVKCPTGTKYLFRGAIPKANETFWFPLWDGMGPDGKRLPSATYDWTLKLSQSGASRTYTGKISVSRIWFALTGSSKGSAATTHAAYMVPGNANCYVSGTTAAASDVLSIALSGPSGYRVPARAFSLGSARPLNASTYFRDASAPKTRGTHTWSVSARGGVAYRITVIQ